MTSLRFFLGLVFGHLPTVHAAGIATTSAGEIGGKQYPDFSRELHLSREHGLPMRRLTKQRGHRPLLDCHSERQRVEFANVLKKWFRRNSNPERNTANRQFLNCFHRRNYPADRVVAAANMFDLLPASDWPHPEMKDLKKKVKAKADIVLQSIGASHLPKFCEMIDHAVECRNHYVHGKAKRLDYEKENVMAFLTDTLEFVYGISELIECGWEVEMLHTLQPNDHPFSGYLTMYESHLVATGA